MELDFKYWLEQSVDVKKRSHKKRGGKEPILNTAIDTWLRSVDNLKKDKEEWDKEKSKPKSKSTEGKKKPKCRRTNLKQITNTKPQQNQEQDSEQDASR